MPITFTDESRFQPIADLETRLRDEGLAGTILNVEDPAFVDKAHMVLAYGRLLGGYKWIYPDQAGDRQAGIALDRIDSAGLSPGALSLGLWADHEDGPPPWQITRAVIDTWHAWGWTKAGYYSNAHQIEHEHFGDVPWWYAAYPGRNDGTYPGPITWALPRDPVFWQFSSTGGRLDVNVVVDEAFLAQWVTTIPIPATPPAPIPEDDMKLVRVVETGAISLIREKSPEAIGDAETAAAWQAAGYELREINQREYDLIANLLNDPADVDETAAVLRERDRCRTLVRNCGFGQSKTRERIATIL